MHDYEYRATNEDFLAIKEGIKTVWHPELNYIFKDKGLFENLSIVSYDCRYIYLWNRKNFSNLEKTKYNIQNFISYKIPHNIELTTVDCLGWMAEIQNEKIVELLPKEIQESHFKNPTISGSLLGDFIATQKMIKGEKNNPYITLESYLATIVHEFGHTYYNQHKLWYFSNKQNNIILLKKALSLYTNDKVGEKIALSLPSPYFLSEVFAFCTDYSAASIFWPDHKKDIDQSNINKIKEWINKEKNTDLDKEDSVLNQNDPHIIGLIIGKILIHTYPKVWTAMLLKRSQI